MDDSLLITKTTDVDLNYELQHLSSSKDGSKGPRSGNVNSHDDKEMTRMGKKPVLKV